MLPLKTQLGKLKITEVLEWYDKPLLFVAENASGDRYLAFWADEFEGGDLWLYSLISERRISDLIAGKLELRKIYTEPEDEIIFLVRIADGKPAVVEPIAPEQLDQEYLPPSGDFGVDDEDLVPESTLAENKIQPTS